MADSNVFHGLFVIAWPVWAGGYPDPQEALRILGRLRDELEVNLTRRVRRLLGNDAKLGDLRYQAGGYNPIRGLSPRRFPPNSIELSIVVTASYALLHGNNSPTASLASTMEDLTDVIRTFFLDHMPGARQGANIYKVESRWELGPGTSYTGTGKRRPYVYIIRR